MCANLKYALLLWTPLDFWCYTASTEWSTSHPIPNDLNPTGIFVLVHKLHLWLKQFLCKEQRERGLRNGYILLLKTERCLIQPTVTMNAFTPKYHTGEASVVTFKKCFIVLLLWSRKVYLYPHLDRWPWGHIIWFAACFHLIENRIQHCCLLFKCCLNPLPKSSCKRQCSLAFITEIGQAQGKNPGGCQTWKP